MQADEATEDLRDEVRRFLAQHPPESFPCEHGDLGYGFGAWSSAYLRVLGEHGWIDLTWPKNVGGQGHPAHNLYVLLTELAYARAPAEALFYSLAVAHALYTFGSPELQQEFLPRTRRGELTFAEALSEPGAGSDLLALRTRAQERGDHYVINGHKTWISNGWLADYALLAARTSDDAPRHKGISVFLVDLEAPGVDRRPIEDLSGEPSFSEIFLTDVVVPRRHLLGTKNAGLQHILDALEWDRLWARCGKAPFLRRELEDAIRQCQEAGPDGRTRWDDPVLRDRVADVQVRIDVCQALFDEVVSEVVMRTRDVTQDVSIAKMFADQLGQHVTSDLADVLGIQAVVGAAPVGSSPGGHVGQLCLSAHGLLIAGGTPEMQQAVIATRGLGLPKQRG